MKVKLFTKLLKPKLNFWMKPIEEMDCGLEAEVNHWLSDNQSVEIKEIKQSQSGGSFVPSVLSITVWYQ